MSFVIDESAILRMLGESRPTYTVTSSNLGVSTEPPYTPLFPVSISSSTVPVRLPHMSAETRGRLLDLRRRIVESGARLLTTEELDDEIAERKGQSTGY